MEERDTSTSTQPVRRTTPPSRPKEETARLGREIYTRDIRPLVEADHIGKVVAIDVDSGEWAIGDESMDAVDRLWAQSPDSYDVWCERVGYRAVGHMGWRGTYQIVR